MGYISSVLPSLGDEAVVQLPMQALGPRVRIGRVDPPELRRLKGDRRVLRLILRGLRNRQRVEAVPVPLTVDGQAVELDGRRIATRARQLAGRPHNEGYRMLRAFLVAEATAALTRGPLPAVPTLRGEAVRDIDNYLDRVWPSLTPQTFLVELCSSRRQLLAAGAGTLSEAELDMLALPTGTQVTSWSWSVDDVPILDAADALLNGVAATYEHIVVDEAQDLSPLQLESIRRRSRAGSITVLGDLAQGTAPWAHSSWDPIVQALRHERVTAETVELDYGYRLPAEVHEVAMRLLPEVAPGMSCPQALRSSGHEIATVPAAPADLAGAVVDAVHDLAADGIVGVITPASARPARGGRARRRRRRLVVRAPPLGRARRRARPRRGQGPRVRLGGRRRAGGDRERDRPRPPVAVRGPDPLHQPPDARARPAAARRPRSGRRRRGRERGPRRRHPCPIPTATRPPTTRASPRWRCRSRSLTTTPDGGRRPGSALADRVVGVDPRIGSSTRSTRPMAVAALDDIDHDIARAVAAAIVDKLVRAVGPSLLPLVAEEIARALAVAGGPGRPAPAGARQRVGPPRPRRRRDPAR